MAARSFHELGALALGHRSDFHHDIVDLRQRSSRFALHTGSGPRPPLRVARPANHYFPVRSAEFETLLRSGGLRLASSESVTSPWSQLTLMHVVSM